MKRLRRYPASPGGDRLSRFSLVLLSLIVCRGGGRLWRHQRGARCLHLSAILDPDVWDPAQCLRELEVEGEGELTR